LTVPFLTHGIGAWRSQRRFRFLVIGAYNTGFGYACFVLLYITLGVAVNYLLIQVFAHFLSVLNAFYWHRRVTFRSSLPWWPEFLRFNLSYLGVLAASLVALPLMVRLLHIHPLLAAAVITAAGVVASYVLHARFSFAPESDPD
jgi:putative flippase GtrA